jgi:hypothetical protein
LKRAWRNKIRLFSLISRRLNGSMFSDCRDERGARALERV